MTQLRKPLPLQGDTLTLDLSGPQAHAMGAAIAEEVRAALGEGVRVSLRRKGCSEAIRQMAASSFSVIPELNECTALAFRGLAGTALGPALFAAVAKAMADRTDGVHTLKMKFTRGPSA